MANNCMETLQSLHTRSPKSCLVWNLQYDPPKAVIAFNLARPTKGLNLHSQGTRSVYILRKFSSILC